MDACGRRRPADERSFFFTTNESWVIRESYRDKRLADQYGVLCWRGDLQG
jgi:hypothetical protein